MRPVKSALCSSTLTPTTSVLWSRLEVISNLMNESSMAFFAFLCPFLLASWRPPAVNIEEIMAKCEVLHTTDNDSQTGIQGIPAGQLMVSC